MESRVLFEAVQEMAYLSTFSYLAVHYVVLPLNLLFLGEWGQALREINDTIAIVDKNGDYRWGQSVRLCRAFVHLHAMDFAGALSICNSALPLVSDPESHPAPDYPAPYPIQVRISLFLMGSAETGLGNYESALEHLLAARAGMDRLPAVWDWWWRMPVESALTELWLAKGDLAQARLHAERFMAIAFGTEEHTWQALAWEVNARVAIAGLDLTTAQDCIAKGLSAMEGFEIPLAAWRIHATAFELYRKSSNRDLAEHHLALSRETVMKLANSLLPEEPLRQTFLSAPTIRKILGDGDIPISRWPLEELP